MNFSNASLHSVKDWVFLKLINFASEFLALTKFTIPYIIENEIRE